MSEEVLVFFEVVRNREICKVVLTFLSVKALSLTKAEAGRGRVKTRPSLATSRSFCKYLKSPFMIVGQKCLDPVFALALFITKTVHVFTLTVCNAHIWT